MTAVLAATAVTGNAQAALQIAFNHMTYSAVGFIIIHLLPFLRLLPVPNGRGRISQASGLIGNTALADATEMPFYTV